jgi:hypothetical protein
VKNVSTKHFTIGNKDYSGRQQNVVISTQLYHKNDFLSNVDHSKVTIVGAILSPERFSLEDFSNFHFEKVFLVHLFYKYINKEDVVLYIV